MVVVVVEPVPLDELVVESEVDELALELSVVEEVEDADWVSPPP